MKNIYTFAFMVIAIFSVPVMAIDHNDNFILSNTFTKEMHSKVNGIKYNLYINLPKSYATNTKHYPIICLLDADYSFLLAKQIAEHLSDRNRIKEAIIIGIAYADSKNYKTNRTRDYTPSFVASGGYGPQYQKYSGGAEQFYQFINSELIPYLSDNYRINHDYSFVGHSFGALFGAYLLIKHPELFNNYVIVSPSLWYDNHLLLKMANNKADFNSDKVIKIHFFIGAKENGGDYKMVEDIKLLNTMLNTKPHKNTFTTLDIIKDEDHDTIFPTALTQSLMKIYG